MELAFNLAKFTTMPVHRMPVSLEARQAAANKDFALSAGIQMASGEQDALKWA
jgi:hypothetical protein